MSDDREEKVEKVVRGDERTEPSHEREAGESLRAPVADETVRTQVADPADVVPVPPAMSAAEIDERAKVVEKLRHERDTSEGDARREP